MERVDPEGLEEWKNDLNEPLPWHDSDSEYTAELESDSFMKMMQTGGG